MTIMQEQSCWVERNLLASLPSTISSATLEINISKELEEFLGIVAHLLKSQFGANIRLEIYYSRLRQVLYQNRLNFLELVVGGVEFFDHISARQDFRSQNRELVVSDYQSFEV